MNLIDYRTNEILRVATIAEAIGEESGESRTGAAVSGRVPFQSSWCGPAGYEEICRSSNMERQTVIDPKRRARFYVFGGCAELDQYWASAWEFVPGAGWLPCPCPKRGTWESWLEEADEASAAAAIEAAAIVKAAADAAAESLRLFWLERSERSARANAAFAAQAAEGARKAAKRNRTRRTGRAGGPGRCL